VTTDTPDLKNGLTHKCEIGPSPAQEGYITANVDEDGKLIEVFLHGWGKSGSTLEGWVQLFAFLFSEALQHGVEFDHLARTISQSKFPPGGETSNPEIPKCHSVPDYLCRWLALRFGNAELLNELTAHDKENELRGLANGSES
jgi:hypothetical protein